MFFEAVVYTCIGFHCRKLWVERPYREVGEKVIYRPAGARFVLQQDIEIGRGTEAPWSSMYTVDMCAQIRCLIAQFQ